VEQVVASEGEAVHEGERRIRSLDFGHGDGAIERHDRTRRAGQQLVVQLEDLPPVRGARLGRIAMHGIDRGLDLVRAGLVANEALPDDHLAFGDQVVIPTAAVLIGEPHQVTVGGGAGGAPRLDEQHQREQHHHLRFGRYQLGQEPSEADSLRT